MKTVKVYIETTITGPSKPKYGKYAAALAFTRKNGKTEDRFLQGSERETTYNRSVLLAMVRAMQRFTESCHIIFYTGNTFIPQYGSGRQSGKVETCRVEKVGWKRYTEQGTVAVVPGREQRTRDRDRIRKQQ